jgi:hypothetical protein
VRDIPLGVTRFRVREVASDEVEGRKLYCKVREGDVEVAAFHGTGPVLKRAPAHRTSLEQDDPVGKFSISKRSCEGIRLYQEKELKTALLFGLGLDRILHGKS